MDTSSSCRAPFTPSLVLFLAHGPLVSSLTPMCRVVNGDIHHQGNSAYVTAPAAKNKLFWGELGLANKGCSSLAQLLFAEYSRLVVGVGDVNGCRAHPIAPAVSVSNVTR